MLRCRKRSRYRSLHISAAVLAISDPAWTYHYRLPFSKFKTDRKQSQNDEHLIVTTRQLWDFPYRLLLCTCLFSYTPLIETIRYRWKVSTARWMTSERNSFVRSTLFIGGDKTWQKRESDKRRRRRKRRKRVVQSSWKARAGADGRKCI